MISKMQIRMHLLKCINIFFVNKKYHCNICNANSFTMLPKGKKGKIFNEQQIIGGGYRENSFCIYCGSYDRERFVYYIMQKYTDIFKSDKKILHIAPEIPTQNALENSHPYDNYYTADIVQGNNKLKVDITKMQFENNTFDYFICNHVLEHIIDEASAIKEIKRILTTEGVAIITVPISANNKKTIEYDGVTDKSHRFEKYGQIDHVRLYGNDLKDRLEKYRI